MSQSEVATSHPSTDDNELQLHSEPPDKTRRDASFWFVILGINLSSFLGFLEVSIVSNALPTIVNDLHGTDYIWTAAAYNLAATALMPSTGALAQVFGRKAVVVGSLVIFSVGSAVCGAAKDITFLISGRTVQGIGGAGILSVSTIIISDIVPLAQRGAFNGILQLTWCLACAIGPILGGKLAENGHWRWIFYLNLPIALLAGFMVVTALHLKIPRRNFAENMQQLDWMGNFLVISGTTMLIIGMVWGGARFPWSSAHVLVPLCLGAVGLLAFVLYEYMWSPRPLVPVNLMLNRTTLSGYLQVMIFPIPFIAVVYYLPLYFQACKGDSPFRSDLLIFGISFSTPPIAMLSGIAVTLTKRYRVQLWAGWVMIIVGLALLGTTHANTSLTRVVGYEILAGAGFGVVFAATYFPILAPLPLTSTAQALAFLAFLRQFTQTIGISIGGTILQNQLLKRLPLDLLSQFSTNGGQAIDIVPQLQNLPQQELEKIREVFSDALDILWYVMAGISGIGLLVSIGMRHYELHTKVDEDWGVKEKDKEKTAKH